MKTLITSILLLLSCSLFAQITVNIDNQGGVLYAYINTPAATTTTDAGTYYYLQGTFTNETTKNWALVSDTVTYQGLRGLALIAITGSLSTNTANTEVTLALKKNGIVEPNSLMTVEIDKTTDIGALAVIDLIAMKSGDNISIWISSDKAGALITAQTLTTSAIILR